VLILKGTQPLWARAAVISVNNTPAAAENRISFKVLVRITEFCFQFCTLKEGFHAKAQRRKGNSLRLCAFA
jgi:hypothetical protein